MNSSTGLALFLAAECAARLRAEAARDRRARAIAPTRPARTFLGRRLGELRAAMPAAEPVAHDHVAPCVAC